MVIKEWFKVIIIERAVDNANTNLLKEMKVTLNQIRFDPVD